MTAKPEVRERLTAAEAQAKGLVPTGHVWDEDTQQPIERGTALMVAQLDKHVDLAANLNAFAKNRATLMRFVKEYLQEAEYDSRDLPVPGKMHDFYKVPGAQTKALTKLGAEKLGHLFRFGRSDTQIVSTTETKEYVSATAKCILSDQYRREIGSAVSSCSTAESGFSSERAKKKYGGDYRAALNDVVARATKRAFVQAMIVATAADEVFVAAEEGGDPAPVEPTTPDAPPPEVSDEPTSTTPWPNNDAMNGKTIKQWSEAGLLWLCQPGRNVGPHTETWQALAADELKRRTKK